MQSLLDSLSAGPEQSGTVAGGVGSQVEETCDAEQFNEVPGGMMVWQCW